jgi:hypothetical protein
MKAAKEVAAGIAQYVDAVKLLDAVEEDENRKNQTEEN